MANFSAWLSTKPGWQAVAHLMLMCVSIFSGSGVLPTLQWPQRSQETLTMPVANQAWSGPNVSRPQPLPSPPEALSQPPTDYGLLPRN